jgi:small Trp-rich protein
MYLVILGVLLLGLRWLDVAPMAQWPIWAMYLPFGVALLWWYWCDASGRTRRLQEEKFEERRRQRRQRALVALGALPKAAQRKGR